MKKTIQKEIFYLIILVIILSGAYIGFKYKSLVGNSKERFISLNYNATKTNNPIRSYYDNGKLKYEMKYLSKEFGYIKSYYENGNLAVEGNIKNDNLEGIVKRYDLEGNLLEETNYKNGIKDGVFRKYYENGVLFAQGIYQADKLIGNVKLFSLKNSDIIVVKFKDGEPLSTAALYDKNGLQKDTLSFNKSQLAEVKDLIYK